LIERKGGSVTPRDLMRSSRQFASAEDAEFALKALAAVGLGTWETTVPSPQGGHPACRFVLISRADADRTSVLPGENQGSVNVNAADTPTDPFPEQSPPVAGSHVTGCEWTATPSLQLTVMLMLKVSDAVTVRPPETEAYAWLTAHGSVHDAVDGS
jgi:hypothetical protein